METNTYQDIINYEPQLLKAIHDDEISKIISDSIYAPIITILRKGPMTVKEIEEAYNRVADAPKSDKTIYRYLKELEKAELVVPAGQRVVLGKTATETLFSRTARAFYIQMNIIDFWLTENGKNLAHAIGKLLTPLFDNVEPDPLKLQSFFHRLLVENMNYVENLTERVDADVWKLMNNLDWRKFTNFFDLGGLLAVFIKKPEFLAELKQIFSK
ncbi:MAG: winged helix-turn-helix domain-containing protein [Candidatus Kariarchaeaceae archaeon]